MIKFVDHPFGGRSQNLRMSIPQPVVFAMAQRRLLNQPAKHERNYILQVQYPKGQPRSWDPEEPVKIICQKVSNYVNISGPCPQEPPTRNGRLVESLHKNNAKLEELLSTTVSLAFKYCRSAARTAYQPLNFCTVGWITPEHSGLYCNT